MRKFKIFLLLLLSFTFVTFVTVVKGAFPVAVPEVIIEGEYDEETNSYKSEIEIFLKVDKTNYPNATIQYMFFEGIPPSNWSSYINPIKVQRRGMYRIVVRAKAGDLFSEEYAENINVDLPYDHDYRDVVRNGNIVNHKNTGEPIVLPDYEQRDEEIRGVWVSTVSNIDIGQHTTDEAYKQEIIEILNTIQHHNMNTVFWQVRPMNDAIYPSDLAPYSRYIKGQQGLGLDWDILEFVIDESHKRGLELHAWLNPYRVANNSKEDPTPKQELLNSLHDDNYAKKNPEYTLMSNDQRFLILDPGQPAVRQYLLDVIDELITKYDVDGVHFDDYFYVNSNEDNQTFIDHNPKGFSSKSDWRRENVNMMVESVNDLVKHHNSANNKKVKFGISPVGIWANGGTHGSNTSGYNAYNDLYADTRKWVIEEWVDYICPQIYFDFAYHPAAYEVILDWWVDVIRTYNVDVDILVGLGFYRYTDNTPWTDENIIVEEIRYYSQYEEVKGSVMFSYRTFVRSSPPINKTIEMLNEYYWSEPANFAWDTDVTFVPKDDQEAVDIKTEIEQLAHSIERYIEVYDIQDDTGLTYQDKKINNLYVSKEALETIDSVINFVLYAIDARVTKETLIYARTTLEDAYVDFKDQVYEGSFDPNREGAITSLQTEINKITIRRALINDSEGKDASQLEKGKYYADSIYLDAVDNLLNESYLIIADGSSTSVEILDVLHRLKMAESELNSNYFQGELEESTDPDEDEDDFTEAFTNFETKFKRLNDSLGKAEDELKKGHQYLPTNLYNEVKELYEEAKALNESGEATKEEIEDIMARISTIETKINENVIIGTHENDYRPMLRIIGIVLGSLAIVGAVTIAVLAKRKK